MNSIEQNICDAIDIIVNQALSKAEYDKTIQATVISCIDPTIGKYKVKYQDSTFYAYSGSSDITYTNNSNVYILVPGGDMSKDKTILGTTKKLGINYVPTIEGDDAYDVNGQNCIKLSKDFGLCSYRKGNYVKTVYTYDGNENDIELDIDAVNEYIKNSHYIICGGTIRTELPPEQQYKGNYGIIFGLDFKDNATEEIVTRNYVVDVDTMLGNPYKLVYDTRQYGIFEIDNENFEKVNYIALFTKDFPRSSDNLIDDIFISKLELSGAERLTQNQLSTYSLSFLTPQGTFFDDNSSESEEKTIQAQVRVKGKVIDNNSQDLSFYWFTENVGVTANHAYYNKYGGQGWKCLNDFNVIQEAAGLDPRIVEWVPARNQYIVKKSDIVAREVKFKCVVVYDGTTFSNTIVIKNYSSSYDIKIESDSGDQFYFDNGSPTLTCFVNGEENISNDFKYAWAVTSNTNIFNPLEETTDLNNTYNNLENEYNVLLQKIENNEEPLASHEDELRSYESQLESFNKTMRVDNNKIYHLDIKTITGFSTYQCSVYLKDFYLGTASIVIKNTLTAEGAYSLIINNGSCTYKYNESGISPTSSAASDAPQEINALTFIIYDNNGNRIDDEIAQHSDIKWIVPTKDTLLEIPDGYKPSAVDLINNTNTYSGQMSFSYNIADKYSASKTRNDISLLVNYKDIQLAAKTNFTFTKEGDSGTNGTEFVCKIVPNVADGEIIPNYPAIDIDFNDATWMNNFVLNYTIPVRAANDRKKWFKVQLWHNADKILDTSGSRGELQTSEGKTAVVEWSILRNKYDSQTSDMTFITIEDPLEGLFNINTSDISRFNVSGGREMPKQSPANIVKVTVSYDGVLYYATIPVVFVLKSSQVRGANFFNSINVTTSNYNLSLKDNTGFKYAVYSADGRMPQYDNVNPFEVILKEQISRNGKQYWEDITNKKIFNQQTANSYAIDYHWELKGSIFNFDEKDLRTGQWEDAIYLEKDESLFGPQVQAYQCLIKPKDEYDGFCVTNTVQCIASFLNINGNRLEGLRIIIPVHLLLNKFGNAAINEWDGNSVDINEDGGSILAPQIGAGQKESDNSFTGVLMGKVKEANKSVYDIGLLGYNKGTRTIFLDSEDGSATFGAGTGQIIIDPSSNKALLYSHNYWKEYNQKGKPKNYDKNNINTEGMLIDLSTPSILFGSGNFVVDKDGHITAKGGGSIAGWNIDDDSLFTGDSKDDPTNVRFSSIDFKRSINKEKVTNLRLALNTHFGIDKEGTTYMGSARIGSGTKKIIIDADTGEESALYSNGKDRFTSDKSGFYIGTDGFALGRTYNNNDSGEYISNFQVDNDGNLYARTGYIGTKAHGWEIKEDSLQNNQLNYTGTTEGKIEGTRGVYLSPSGIGLGHGNFYVDNSGQLYSKSGTIGGWTIGNDSLYTEDGNNFSGNNGIYIGRSGIRLGRTFSVDKNGKMASSSGTIGGWNIESKFIKAGLLQLNDDGSIVGPNWSITNQGLATFNDVNITGGMIKLGGSTITSSGGGGGGTTTLGSGSTYVSGGSSGTQALDRYIKDLAVESLTVSSTFNFQSIGMALRSFITEIESIDLPRSGSGTARISYRTYRGLGVSDQDSYTIYRSSVTVNSI